MLSNKRCDSTDNYLDPFTMEYAQTSDFAIKHKVLHQQPKEKYYGNREYKRHLILDSKNIKNEHTLLQKRCTQLLFRIREGRGKAVYLIGVEDNGNANGLLQDECIKSIKNFIVITETIGVKINKMRIYTWKNKIDDARYCVIFKVVKTLDDIHCLI
jgi:GTPase